MEFVFHDMPVPCMYAWVPLRSVLAVLVGIFFKKLIEIKFRGTFCFAQKGTQWVKNSEVFWKKKYLAFSGNNLKWNIVIYILLENPLPVESLVLNLCVKMLLANEIAGFFKVQYLKKKVRDQDYFL